MLATTQGKTALDLFSFIIQLPCVYQYTKWFLKYIYVGIYYGIFTYNY